MLTDYQRGRLWEHMLAAETRALYFGDLASSLTLRKQWITGVSFFFSSGAAAAIVGKAPAWVPLVLAVVVAAATAYAIAVGLDTKIATMAKLHSTWAEIATQYEQIWTDPMDERAADQFDVLIGREREPSDLAVTAAPNDEKRMGKWQDRVIAMRHLQLPT
jgi:hypothetical protein